jgi:ATP-dependent exoDNAse (exonuclease V) beta subunit
LHVLADIEPTSLPSVAAMQIITRSEYIAYIKEAYDPEDARARVENIQELLDAIKHAESQGTRTITEFIEEVTLMQEKSSKQDEKHAPVLLMTLHAAKGLEFDTVILAGLEEGLLPSTRSMNSTETLEEERRLFYVGITRAKERLLLTQAKYRYTYGQMVDQAPSRFVGEIPQQLLHQQDCFYWKQPQIHSYFSDWLCVRKTSFVDMHPTPQAFTTQPIATRTNITYNQKSTSPIVRKPASNKPAVVPTSLKSFDGHGKTMADRPSVAKAMAGKQPDMPHTSNSAFKVNHPVTHAKYGVGIVQKIEDRADNTTYVTVKFKSGTKKITSEFLQKV